LSSAKLAHVALSLIQISDFLLDPVESFSRYGQRTKNEEGEFLHSLHSPFYLFYSGGKMFDFLKIGFLFQSVLKKKKVNVSFLIYNYCISIKLIQLKVLEFSSPFKNKLGNYHFKVKNISFRK